MVIRGKKEPDSKIVLVNSAVHGDELQGIRVVQMLFDMTTITPGVCLSEFFVPQYWKSYSRNQRRQRSLNRRLLVSYHFSRLLAVFQNMRFSQCASGHASFKHNHFLFPRSSKIRPLGKFHN